VEDLHVQNAQRAQGLQDQNAPSDQNVHLIQIAQHAAREEVKVEEEAQAQDQLVVDVQTVKVEETRVVSTLNAQNLKLLLVQSVQQKRQRIQAVTIEGRMYWAQDQNARKRQRNLCVTKMRRSLIVQTHVSA
jgi:hypothetical protein